MAENRGALLNSWSLSGEDGATGEMLSPMFKVSGDFLRFRIGGGRRSDGLGVELLVDGVVERRATGCNSEIMGIRVWSLEGLKGKKAQIRVLDRARRGWGHVLVDEIKEWRQSDRS